MKRILDKKEKASKAAYRHSLKRQITIIFVGIMALTMLAVFLATSFLLEKFYLRDKESSLLNV